MALDAYNNLIVPGDIVASLTGVRGKVELGIVTKINPSDTPSVLFVHYYSDEYNEDDLATYVRSATYRKCLVLNVIPPTVPPRVVQKLMEEREKIIQKEQRKRTEL